MSRFVCEMDTLTVNTPSAYTVNGMKVLLVRTKDQVFAIENECPHQSRSMVTSSVDGEHLRCQFHGLVINLRTGELVDSAGYIGLTGVATYGVNIDGGKVYVEM